MNHQSEDAPGHVRVWSAGGVVIRRNTSGQAEVVVCRRESEDLWALPKGTPDGNEKPLETALREVTEETGLDVAVVTDAGTISYSFARSAVSNPRYHELVAGSDEVIFDKQVHFYLMKPTGGDISLHDHEFDSVVWLTADEARRRLTHESESGIVEKALAILEGQFGGTP